MLKWPAKLAFWMLDLVGNGDPSRQMTLHHIGLGALLGVGITGAVLLAEWLNGRLLHPL